MRINILKTVKRFSTWLTLTWKTKRCLPHYPSNDDDVIMRRSNQRIKENKSDSELKKFKPFTLNSFDAGQIRQINGGIEVKAGVRSEEVVVRDEESSEDGGAVDVFEAAASAGVEFVGTVEAFDELFERAV